MRLYPIKNARWRSLATISIYGLMGPLFAALAFLGLIIAFEVFDSAQSESANLRYRFTWIVAELPRMIGKAYLFGEIQALAAGCIICAAGLRWGFLDDIAALGAGALASATSLIFVAVVRDGFGDPYFVPVIVLAHILASIACWRCARMLWLTST